MSTLSGADVSNPQGPIAGVDVIGYYLGGMTPHVWSKAQLDEQPARYRFGIWVPDAAVNPKEAADQCAARMVEMGQPKFTLYALDLETWSLPAWVQAFAEEMHTKGWPGMTYGSASSLFANPPLSGWWVAFWDYIPHLYPHPFVIGTQYTDKGIGPHGQPIDLSVWKTGLPFWDARPVPPPPPPPWVEGLRDDVAEINHFANNAMALINQHLA